MGKPWSAFFAPAREGGVKGLLLFTSLAICAAGGLGWIPAPAFAAPTDVLTEAEFLALPSYDLESAKPGTVKVGDEVLLKPVGRTGPLVAEFPTLAPVAVASPGPGASPNPVAGNLNDSGWEILPRPLQEGVVAVPLRAGALTLPSLLLRDPGGNRVGRTNPFNLLVASAIKADDPKPQEPADLRPPVGLQFPWWVLVLFGLLAVLLLVGLVIGLQRWSASRRPKKAPVAPLRPPRPEDEVALESLVALERLGLVAKGEFKLHYFRLSEIIKAYLGGRYRIDALESTTRELLAHLEAGRAAPDTQLDRIESIFNRLDLVKFTDHVPEAGEGAQLLESAKQLVLATRRPAPAAPVMEVARAP